MPKVKSAAALKIGKRIRAVRRQLGLSLEDLGQLSEISWTNIGKIERGDSSPTAESLVRLATALEVDPGMFLTGISADDYGRRSHRFTVGDLIRGRDQHLAAGSGVDSNAGDGVVDGAVGGAGDGASGGTATSADAKSGHAAGKAGGTGGTTDSRKRPAAS